MMNQADAFLTKHARLANPVEDVIDILSYMADRRRVSYDQDTDSGINTWTFADGSVVTYNARKDILS